MISLIPQDEIVATSYWKEIIRTYKYEMSLLKNKRLNHIGLSILAKIYTISSWEKEKMHTKKVDGV